jgi:selenium metabolism protein YedF
MDILDCRGQSCPVPVTETKKLIEQYRPTDVKVRVDGAVPRDNVQRFLESRGYGVTVEPTADGFLVVGSRLAGETAEEDREKRVSVFIDCETLGRGDDDLGRILMKSFVITLKELKPLPWRIIFMNGGVKAAAEGSELLPHLQELENLGVEVLSCGTCLDFFHLKEKLKIGRVSNMFEIINSLTESSSVLKP